MSLGQRNDEPVKPRVLLFSQRNIHRNLFRCPHYELEDLVCEMDAAEILAPKADGSFTTRQDIAKRIAWHMPFALNPGVPETHLTSEYDLFFAICGSPVDMLIVNTVRNRQEKCKLSVCLLDELWMSEMPRYKHFIKMLAGFDIVMPYYSQGVKMLASMTGKKVAFVPPGIDAQLFAPEPDAERTVDVYSVGRRSEVTHQRLLAMASRQEIFYVYDTIAASSATRCNEHRQLFANIAKRSKFFLVNPALVDRTDVRGDQHELGNRYFEGAAAGAVMIGAIPKNEEFDKLCDWPDAVIELPFGSEKVDGIVRELNRQPDRLREIRRNNVCQTLLRHDWAYRWEAILGHVGLEPLPGLLARKERLKSLAAAAMGEGGQYLADRAATIGRPQKWR